MPDPDATIENLRKLMDSGDHAALTAAAGALILKRPQGPFARRFLALGLSGQGRTDEARAELSRARELGLPDRAWLATRLELARRARDWPEIVDATEALGNHGGELGGEALELYAEALVETGAAATASLVADEILRRFPNQTCGVRAKFRALAALYRPDTIARACEEWIRAPDASPVRAKLLRMLSVHVPALADAAQDILLRLYQETPDSPVVTNGLAVMRMKPDGAGGLEPMQRQAYRRLGAATDPFEKLTDALDIWFPGPRADKAPLLACLARDFGDTDFARPLIDDDPLVEVIASRPGPAGETAVIFVGMHANFDMPIVLLDAYFAAAGVATIFLRDNSKRLYFGGIASLGDGVESTLAALRDRIAATSGQDQRLSVWGNSGGGIAALRQGVALGAQRIVGTAIATSATAEFVARTGDTRGKLLVNRLYDQFDQSELCGHSALAAATGRLRVDLVYGAGSLTDKAHAEAISGFDGVHLYEIPDYHEHRVALELFRRGLLPDLVAGRLDGNPGLRSI